MLKTPALHTLDHKPASDTINANRAFRERLFVAILGVAMVFALLFAVMHDIGINPLNEFHANVNYAYAGCCLLILLLLRRNSERFHMLVPLFLLVSHLTFTSALINVDDDQFRAIWFYLLVLVAYMLGGPKDGIITTVAALSTFIVVNLVVDLGFSDVTFNSMFIGLVILSILAEVYTQRAIHYAQLVRKQNRQLEQLASEDSLTGIMNARSYYKVGQQLFELARRRSKELTLLYLDIDYFKNINDRHGHHTGDRVLIAITRTIASVLRKSDVFARIGGEEFCIILPETDLKGGKLLAEKIRHTIETTAIPLENETLYPTASIGVSALCNKDSEMQEVQSRADKNLYEAKRNGRNRVIAD